MARVPIKQVLICGLLKNRKAILEALQRFGNFEIINIECQKESFAKVDTAAFLSDFTSKAKASEQALEILTALAPPKTNIFNSLNGKIKISAVAYYEYAAKIDEFVNIVNRIILLDKTIANQKSEILKLNMAKDSLSPWLDLKVPLNFKGTKETTAYIGAFPKGTEKSDFLNKYAQKCAEENIDCPIELLFWSEGNNQTCVFIICLSKHKDFIESFLKKSHFSYPAHLDTVTPLQKSQDLDMQIQKAESIIKTAQQEIKEYSEFKDALKFVSDYYFMRLEKYKALAKAQNLKRTFFIWGFVPCSEIKKLESMISLKYDGLVEAWDAPPDENTPILLKNNAFSSPVESIVESYSMPNRHDIDPTAVMSIFYYVLFGLMLGDFAYGVIIALGCALALLKFKNMEISLRKTLWMFFYCGISTAFWGLIFGSCFGDAVTVIGQTFFEADIAFRPLWFEPIEKPIQMLLFSFAIGIIHLFTGLFIRLYLYIKQGKFKDAIYDVLFKYLLIIGGITFLFSVDMFVNMTGLSFKVGTLGANIAKWSAIIGAMGIILTSGRNSKNPFKRFAKGFYELYNMTGYLSDILSYSRLLALGLATGVIAQVFNKIGSMGGRSFFGIILFIVVFLIGHTVNLLINLLGAYVHTNRLQFVEFFGKFYEGGGRKYEPFSENTKYYKIKEDISL